VGCCISYIEEGRGRDVVPFSPLLTVPNVTAHPSMASVPITVLLYDGSLLCGFNAAIKGLTRAGDDMTKRAAYSPTVEIRSVGKRSSTSVCRLSLMRAVTTLARFGSH